MDGFCSQYEDKLIGICPIIKEGYGSGGGNDGGGGVLKKVGEEGADDIDEWEEGIQLFDEW